MYISILYDTSSVNESARRSRRVFIVQTIHHDTIVKKSCWLNQSKGNCEKMLIFRYYLLATIILISLWWPISYLLSCFFYKKRVIKVTRNMPAIDDYPFLGCALRFMGKNNEGFYQTIFEHIFLNFWILNVNYSFWHRRSKEGVYFQEFRNVLGVISWVQSSTIVFGLKIYLSMIEIWTTDIHILYSLSVTCWKNCLNLSTHWPFTDSITFTVYKELIWIPD